MMEEELDLSNPNLVSIFRYIYIKGHQRSKIDPLGCVRVW